jgi:hypothetical protein
MSMKERCTVDVSEHTHLVCAHNFFLLTGRQSEEGRARQARVLCESKADISLVRLSKQACAIPRLTEEMCQNGEK